MYKCNRSDVMGNSPVPHPGPGHPPCNVQNVNLLFLFFNIIISCFSPDRVAVCNVNWNVVREISL